MSATDDQVRVLQMHDATLTTLEVDWAAGMLRVNFKQDKLNTTIAATGLTLLSLPREYPWGPSASVNGITVQKTDDGVLIKIEMQSGDLIRAHIAEYTEECS